ncbi:MAG: AraC family transcriptional regulator [Firmicutes bacterium]|nr:AraC family transcriptional regulator [Bacillota bacterium]
MDSVYILNDYMTTHDMRIGTQIMADDRDKVYHSHEFYEIFYITEGSITHLINGKKEHLTAGDIRLIRLSDTHCFVRKAGNKCAHRDVVIDSGQFKESCDHIDPEFFLRLTESKTPPKAFIPLERIQHFETEINRIVNMPNRSDGVKKSALINVLLSEQLGIFLKTEFAATMTYPEWLENLIARFHMREYMREGLDKILEATNMDKSYICRAFKKFIGMTMSEYLCQVRLNYAANLLQFTDNNIDAVYHDVGFLSASHFNNKFKQRFGHSPKIFRKTARAKS